MEVSDRQHGGKIPSASRDERQGEKEEPGGCALRKNREAVEMLLNRRTG
jgi:hypothetical protein